jgi:hypothetical protein
MVAGQGGRARQEWGYVLFCSPPEFVIGLPQKLSRPSSQLANEEKLSAVGIYLTQTPFDAGPSTWYGHSPRPTWGQWLCHAVSYGTSVLTERDTNAMYVADLNTSSSESES